MALRGTDDFLVVRDGEIYRDSADDVRPFFAGAQSGGSLPYVHTQASAAVQWTVNHNRGSRPAAVSVLTPGGVEVDADVIHTGPNQIIISFNQPFAGSVLIS